MINNNTNNKNYLNQQLKQHKSTTLQSTPKSRLFRGPRRQSTPCRAQGTTRSVNRYNKSIKNGNVRTY